eukprot:jgi/Undpi1/7953/HiC_scaffold_24.g10425.m1
MAFKNELADGAAEVSAHNLTAGGTSSEEEEPMAAGNGDFCEATAGGIGPTATFRCVSCAEEMNPSWRNSMEDAHETIAHFDGDPAMSFFAVYDGHGGRGTVDFVSSRLKDVLSEELREDDNTSIDERITRAYTKTDVESKEASVLTSGATAVTCLLKAEHGEVTLYSANIGDRSALESNFFAHLQLVVVVVVMTVAEDAPEQERVERAGGFVLRNRVLGILAVSRSFGNQGMKEFVISEPFISETRLGSDCKFLIIACDGVWDVFTDDEAVTYVTQAMAAMAVAYVAQAMAAMGARPTACDPDRAIEMTR